MAALETRALRRLPITDVRTDPDLDVIREVRTSHDSSGQENSPAEDDFVFTMIGSPRGDIDPHHRLDRFFRPDRVIPQNRCNLQSRRDASEKQDQARIAGINSPRTSVRRISRPLNR